jgi:hypothetical protein
VEYLVKSKYGQWTLKKTEPFKKEQWDQKRQNKVHGWISPEGKYHHMGPNDIHGDVIVDRHDLNGTFEAYNNGWLSVGHGGYNVVQGNPEVLRDRDHPAFKKLRSLAGKHWDNLNINGQDYDVDHLRRHGELKPITFGGISYQTR